MRAIVYFPHLAASEPIESSLVPFFLHALDGLPPTCPEPSPTAKLAPAPHLPPS